MVGQLHFWHWKAPMLHCEEAAQNREMLCQSWWSVWDALKRNHLRGGWGKYSFEVTRLDWVFAAQSECMSLCHFGRGFNLCLHFEKAMLFVWLVGLLALYYKLQIILLSHIRLSALTPPCSPPLSPPRPLPCTPSVHENSPNFFPPTVNNRTLQICTPWSEYKYTLVQISNIYTWIRTFVSCFITIRLIPANPFTRDLIYNSASSPLSISPC